MKTKEELQAIYFGFYDQLPEPWRSEAKEYWDYDYSKYADTPKTVVNAVRWGIDWLSTGEFDKWDKLLTQLLLNMVLLNNTDLPPSDPTLSDIKNQLDRVEVLLNKLIEKK